MLIEKIILKNFCGIASGEWNFAKKKNRISAEFGSGKSSFMHGFQWALGMSVDFEPNIDGKRIEGIETAVTVCMNDGSKTTTLQRTAKQSWKVEGVEKRFDKYTYKYFFDGVEIKAKDYGSQVLAYFNFADDTEMNVFFDAQYFNGTNDPKWNAEKRRAYLFKLFGIAEKTEELAKTYPSIYEELYKNGVDQTTLRKSLRQEKAKIEKSQDVLNVLIDETQKEIATLSGIDFESASAEKNKLWEEYQSLLTSRKNSLNAKQADKIYAEIAEVRQKMEQQKNMNAFVLSTYDSRIREAQRSIANFKSDIDMLNQKQSRLASEFEDLTIDRSIEEDRVFEAETMCPVCGQEIPVDKLEASKKSFEEEKAKRITQIDAQATKNCQERSETEVKLQQYTQKLKAAEGGLEALQKMPPETVSMESYEKQIADLTAKADSLKNAAAKRHSEDREQEIRSKLDEIEATLQQQKTLESLKVKVKERREESTNLANQYINVVRMSNELDEFAVKEILLADQIINSSFDGIKFNFFELLGGSAEKSYKKTCTATMNGIAYDNLSGGQQILCDYLIGCGLRKITGKNLPAWVDEICRITSNESKADVIFDFDGKEFQTIALLTQDGKKLPVSMVKDSL